MTKAAKAADGQWQDGEQESFSVPCSANTRSVVQVKQAHNFDSQTEVRHAEQILAQLDIGVVRACQGWRRERYREERMPIAQSTVLGVSCRVGSRGRRVPVLRQRN